MSFRRRPASLAAAHTDLGDYDADATERSLIERRARHLGLSLLFYHDPIHLIRGEGVWLFDAAGNRYLDCYNNVPSVGHANPRVVAAMAEQAGILNTHTRYLHEAVIDYAEALTATLPDGLERCVFVNSGTEANELAIRMARSVTGNDGVVVMENSYHGNSTLIDELSTMGKSAGQLASHVATVEPPDRYRGPLADSADPGEAYGRLVAEATAVLDRRGHGTAAFLCDGIFDSQGGLEAPPGYFSVAYQLTRDAGGVCIADEVQPGLARTGRMWGFLHDDVVPDIVTFGKPAGNGFPLAGVVTTAEIMDRFSRDAIYFNTFGGNPVAAAVGRTVLAEITERDLPAHVTRIGRRLRERLIDLAADHPSIGNVRGRGLYQGVELVTDRDSKEPAAELARRLPDALKAEGILAGITGRNGNVLKIRPPLVFADEHADQLVETLDRVLPTLA